MCATQPIPHALADTRRARGERPAAVRRAAAMSRRGWALFGTVAILWGFPYLLIKVAVDDGVAPGFVAWVRVALAAGVLLALAWRAGTLAATRGRLRWLALFGVLEVAAPFPLIAAAEQRVASSLAAIVIAAAPLFVALLAVRFDARERASGSRLVGLGVGFAGVVALVGIDVAGRPGELLGIGELLVAALAYAAGAMLIKHRLADLDPRASIAVSLTVAMLLLSPAVAIARPAAVPPTGALVALLALGLLCTAAALVAYAALIIEVGPGRALVFAYINPIVALIAGMAILDERPGAGAIAGLVLILAGCWLSTGGGIPAVIAARLPRALARGRVAAARQPDAAGEREPP